MLPALAPAPGKPAASKPGGADPAQFAENVNDLGEKIKVLGDLRLGEDGAWYYEESPAMAGRPSTVGAAQDPELPVFRYTVENGRLREVTLVWTGEERMSDPVVPGAVPGGHGGPSRPA